MSILERPLPPDQDVRDRITGLMRFGPAGRIQLGGPISEDAHFQEGRGQNMVVLAGAGSGKTHALVWRMVALVRSGVPVEEIAAITFTRKAAGEMRARFYEALRAVRVALVEHAGGAAEAGQLKAAEGYEREQAYVSSALASVDRVFIDTIHAFCGRILRERPIEAGLPPDFVLVEDRDEEIMRRGAWRAYLREQVGTPEYEALVAAGVEPQDLVGFFAQLCELDGIPVVAPVEERPDLEKACDAVIRFVGEWEALLRAHPPQKRDALMRTLETAGHFIRNHGLRTDGDRVTLLEFFEGTLKRDDRKSARREFRAKLTAKNWVEAGVPKEKVKQLDEDALPDLVEEHVLPALAAWRAYLYEPVYRFTQGAVERYRRQRYSEGRLTFMDLLRGAARLLKEHPPVRSHFGRRWRHLLVDEFQDTDPVQAEVLFYLTGENLEARAWQECRPRPGSLFIVGDGKQSIYRFRRADVQVFQEVVRLLTATRGSLLELTASFRSTEPFCAWCNGALEPVFGLGVAPYQTAFAPLRPVRRDRSASPAVMLLRTPAVKGNGAEAIAEQEAVRIAAYIRAACDGHPEALCGTGELFDGKARFGDFLILTRLSKRLPVYAAALERAGVPYQITGGKALGSSDELRAVIGLMECVLRPDDAVARVAYLTGLFCGIDPGALLRFREAGGLFDGDVLPAALAPEDVAIFSRAFGLVSSLRAALREMPASAALERLLDKSGFFAWAARRAPGSARAGNLLRVLSLMRGMEARGRHWTEMLERLQLISSGDIDVEELTLEAGAASAVRLMTVHQAKGLQAKVVFMADPYDSHAPSGSSLFVGRRDGKPFAVVPAARAHGEYASKAIAAPRCWGEPVGEETAYTDEALRFEEAEHHRLTYVAATRAEDLLVLSCYEGKPDEGFWHRLYPAACDTLPELPSPAHSPAPAKLDVPEWAAVRAVRERRRAAAERPTYETRSVSKAGGPIVSAQTPSAGVGDEARGNPPRFQRAGAAYASAYGKALHALFEAAVLHRTGAPDLQSEAHAVRQLLREHALQAHQQELARCRSSREASRLKDKHKAWVAAGTRSAVQALVRFRRSRLWKEVLDSPAAYAEVPLAVMKDTHLVSGTIDLVYRTEDGWKIVDYKTNRVREDLADLYRDQVEGYIRYWKEFTGEPVTEAGLWLTRTGAYVSILPSEATSVDRRDAASQIVLYQAPFGG